MTATMIPVVDAIRDLCEPPDQADDTRSIAGVLIDRTCAQPIGDAQPNTIYAWEAACRERPIGTGEVQQDFEVTVLYIVDGKGEEGVLQRSREVSEALDERRAAYMKLVRDFANIPPWDSGNIQATSDADFIRQLEVRGIAIRVTGYRLVTGE